MTPYEIMLSESQERMLLVVKQGREAEVERIFDKWDLHAVRIGEVTDDGMLRVKDRGSVVAEIPNRALTDEAPVYQRPMETPDYLARGAGARPRCALPAASPGAPNDALLRAARLADDRQQALGLPPVRPHGADQHDQPARAGRRRRAHQGHRPRAGDVGRRQRPLLLPRSAAAARCWPSPKRRATSPAPARGRSARPTASTSAIPSGRRSCGSSRRRSKGIGEACRALGVPITGGNVSLYNETDGQAIYPDAGHRRRRPARARRSRADAALPGRPATSIVLLGDGRGELGGSEYLKLVHGLVRGVPPALDLDGRARAAGSAGRAGGRAPGPLGARLLGRRPGGDARGVLLRHRRRRRRSRRSTAVAGRRSDARLNDAAALFGESASRVVVSATPDHVDRGAAAGRGRAACRRGSSARPAATGCGSRSAGATSSIDVAGRRSRARRGRRAIEQTCSPRKVA